MNIEQALARSRSHTEIVRCTATQEELDGLCAEAEGSVLVSRESGATEPYTDVWGTDDDGVEYRLHITLEG